MKYASSLRPPFLTLLFLIVLGAPCATFSQSESFLTFRSVLIDGVSGVNGLNRVFGTAISPDGRHLYAVAGGDNSISLFQRDRTSGSLVFVAMWHLDIASDTDDHYVTLSPDGKHVYVTAERAGLVMVFERNASSGLLSFVDSIDLASQGFGGVGFMAITPDGTNIFITVGRPSDSGAGGLLQFHRNVPTGRLTLHRFYGDEPEVYSFSYGIYVSPDGKHLYVAGSDYRDTGTLVFRRASQTDDLSLVQIANSGNIPVPQASSHDGSFLFGIGKDDEVISLKRNLVTGEIEAVDSYRIEPDQDGYTPLPMHLVASPSSAHIYVSTSHSRSVYTIEYDSLNGSFEGVDPIVSSDVPQQSQVSLHDPARLSISPDGAFLHVSNPFGESLGIFKSAASNPVSQEFQINPGLNGSWFYPDTAGQGFLIDVFPNSGEMFLAWFTFDTQIPSEDYLANLGDSGQRWMTAQGSYNGNRAELEIFQSTGGIFDSPEPKPVLSSDGTLIIEFTGCNSGTVTYDIPSIGLSGVIPVERIALDNVDFCTTLQ